MGEKTWTYTDKPWPKLPTLKAPEWATYVKGRNPEFKIHTSLGHAKNAITGSGHGVCYRLIDQEWVPVAVVNCVNSQRYSTPTSVYEPPEFGNVSGFKPTEPIYQYVIREAP